MKTLVTSLLFLLLFGGLIATGVNAEEKPKPEPRVELCEECKVKVEAHRKEMRKKIQERRSQSLPNRLQRQNNRANDEVRGPRHKRGRK